MRILSMFSGVGAFDLALRIAFDGWRPAGYVELDAKKRARLEQRIRDGWLEPASIHYDARELDYAGIELDAIAAGYPCREFSGVARGRNTEPSLWPTVERACREAEPAYVLLENVVRDERAIRALERMGFDVRSREVSASDVGAPHVRPRVFTLGRHSDREGEVEKATCLRCVQIELARAQKILEALLPVERRLAKQRRRKKA